MKRNIVLATDSYKTGHAGLYKPSTNFVYSYLESRGGIYDRTTFFGLQYYLREYLQGCVVTGEDVEYATRFLTDHFGRNDYFKPELWMHIVDQHGGKLPIKIKAVPEGYRVPTSNVLMTIENTDPECFWLPNYLETLLVKLWYPITVATQSASIREDIETYMKISYGNMDSVDFKCHDFGYRGCTSEEQAAIGGAAHLLSFSGTDTLAGLRMLIDYYDAPMCGFSVPATEHSVMCSFGHKKEIEAIRNYLNEQPLGTIACVSDTWNIFECCEKLWGTEFKDQVLKRDGCVVIRPDSGDPEAVILRVLDILWEKFEGTYVGDGVLDTYDEPGPNMYKLLDPHVRVIQGDGMDPVTIDILYDNIVRHGWCAENLAVGSGGGLLQKMNRDTCQFAFKASVVGNKVTGMDYDISKNPITSLSKRSKPGLMKLVLSHSNGLETMSNDRHDWEILKDVMQTVFENGEIVKEYTYSDIIKNMIITNQYSY